MKIQSILNSQPILNEQKSEKMHVNLEKNAIFVKKINVKKNRSIFSHYHQKNIKSALNVQQNIKKLDTSQRLSGKSQFIQLQNQISHTMLCDEKQKSSSVKIPKLEYRVQNKNLENLLRKNKKRKAITQPSCCDYLLNLRKSLTNKKHQKYSSQFQNILKVTKHEFLDQKINKTFESRKHNFNSQREEYNDMRMQENDIDNNKQYFPEIKDKQKTNSPLHNILVIEEEVKMKINFGQKMKKKKEKKEKCWKTQQQDIIRGWTGFKNNKYFPVSLQEFQ